MLGFGLILLEQFVHDFLADLNDIAQKRKSIGFPSVIKNQKLAHNTPAASL